MSYLMSFLDAEHKAYLPGLGSVPAKYMIVGLAPSTKRPLNRRFLPFGASSWNLINALFHRYPGQVYVTNLIKTPQPPGQKSFPEIYTHINYLREEMELVCPERVLCFGDVVASVLIPGFTNLREDHGTFFRTTLSHLTAYFIATYHPAAVARQPILKPIMVRDLQRFFDLADPDQARASVIFSVDELDFPEGAEVILDLETTGVEDSDIITLAGFAHAGNNFIRSFDGAPEADRRSFFVEFGRLAKAKKWTLIGHNMAFDYWMMIKETKGRFPRIPIRDTMLMAHVAGEEILSLKHLTSLRTDLPGSRSGGSYQDLTYLAEDLRSTYELDRYYLRIRQKFITPVVHRLVPTVAFMRFNGTHVDRAMLSQQLVQATADKERLETSLAEVLGRRINWNSPVQVAQALLDLDIPLYERTATGALSVKESVLLSLSGFPVVQQLLEYRAASKLVSGFLLPYLKISEEDSLLHPRLLLQGTRTGRLSCRNPNLQQVPRVGPIKLAFVSRWEGGQIALVDFSQAELRMAALLSEDMEFVNALNSADVHRYIASMLLGLPQDQVSQTQRKASKKITFGLLYGGSTRGLAERAGLDESQVAVVMDRFFNVFPKLGGWLKAQDTRLASSLQIHTLFGRERDLTPEFTSGGRRNAYRKAVNTPIQSLANDCMLVVADQIVKSLRQRRLKSRPLFGVHDSFIMEAAPGEAQAVFEVVQSGFDALWNTPLASVKIFKQLPLLGDLKLGVSWANVEETNEAYQPLHEFECSTHANRSS